MSEEPNKDLSLKPEEDSSSVTSYPRYDVFKPGLTGAGLVNEKKGFDIWEISRILLNRKWMILAIVLLGTLAALGLTLRQTPLYQSAASIEILKQETRILESTSVEPVTVADAEHMATQYALLKSRSLIERVVLTLELDAPSKFSESNLAASDRTRFATNRIVQNLKITPEGYSRVINIKFVSPDRHESANVANTLVDIFIESALERKYNTTAYARDFLTQRLSETKATLEKSELELVEYAQREGILDLNVGLQGATTSLDANTLIALNEALAIAQNERIAAENKYLQIRENIPTTEILESEDLARLRATRSELNNEYQEKLGTFKPDYPDMKKLSSRIGAVDREIEIQKQAVVSAVKSSFESAKAKEVSLRNQVLKLKGNVQSQRNNRVNYTILQREVDTARSQYDALLQRLKEVSIASGVGSSQISVVDRAAVPIYPFEPNLIRNLIQAFCLSLGLGVALAFGLNYIDDTIRTPDDVKEKLRLPSLGVIPKVGSRKKGNVVLDQFNDPKSMVFEAYVSARTALDFSTENGAPKTLLVTSTRPSEGKTSSVAALAVSFANVGRRVLVIDADLRKPSFVANGQASLGLSGLLIGEGELKGNVIKSDISNLYLLPSGVLPPNPAELFSGTRLSNLLTEAKRYFDIVIVDSPPVMGFADAPLLGSVCDGVVVVIQSGKIRRQAAERTVGRLKESRANVLGVILSHFDVKSAGYYNSYYYGYGEESNRKLLPNKRNKSHSKINLNYHSDGGFS